MLDLTFKSICIVLILLGDTFYPNTPFAMPPEKTKPKADVSQAPPKVATPVVEQLDIPGDGKFDCVVTVKIFTPGHP